MEVLKMPDVVGCLFLEPFADVDVTAGVAACEIRTAWLSERKH